MKLKPILSTLRTLSLVDSPVYVATRKVEAVKAGGSAAAPRGALGYGAVPTSGPTVAGMAGDGGGIGMAAGPFGAGVGAIIGLAAYGIYRIFRLKFHL